MNFVSEKWYSVKEVSAILGCSCDTVRRLVAAKRLKAIKLTVNSPRRHRSYVTLRISGSDLDEFMRRNAA